MAGLPRDSSRILRHVSVACRLTYKCDGLRAAEEITLPEPTTGSETEGALLFLFNPFRDDLNSQVVRYLQNSAKDVLPAGGEMDIANEPNVDFDEGRRNLGHFH